MAGENRGNAWRENQADAWKAIRKDAWRKEGIKKGCI